jgi:SAM-dependent methyltransferase
MYSERLMGDDSLSEYYRKGFGSDRHRQGQYINARINAWAIGHLVPVGEFHSFLDVGAGYGFLLEQMTTRQGIRSVGVELSEQEARYGQEQLGVDIRNGTLEKSGLLKGSFDLVACFEVIEHIPDPPAFLDELLSYVKPGGYLLVMTDNFESRVARELGPSFPKWIPHSHISHFGPKTLEWLFTDKGIEVVRRLSYTPWELLARLYYSKLRGVRQVPENAFDLSDVLASEMRGRFRLFYLRRVVNTLWARLTARTSLDGALMYLLGRRRS